MFVFRNARLLDPSTQRDEIGDVLVEKGCVARVGPGAASTIPKQNENDWNLEGKWLCPGFIDLHVHFREPGEEYKEDIASGLRAAAAGGFTAVCAMPNTHPVNDTRAITETMLHRAKNSTGPALYPIAAITQGLQGTHLTEMGDLREAGAIGVSDDGRCVMNAEVMRRALQYAGSFDLLVSQHAEDHHLTQGADMHEGAVSTRLGLRGWPRVAEDIIVARDLLLVAAHPARYHVAHISSASAVAMIREAKSRGLPVSAEVTPHHLMFTDKDVIGYRTECKVNPPLRPDEDQQVLREALADGTIDCIATDHAPHSSVEKDCEFSAAAPGIIGLETAMASLLELVRNNDLSALRLIEALSTNPARLAKLPGGQLRVDAPADLCIIDPNHRWTVSRQTLQSKSSNSPLLHKELQGRVMATMVGGHMVFEQ